MDKDTGVVEKPRTNGVAAAHGTIRRNTIQLLTDDIIGAAVGSMANCTLKPDGSFGMVIPGKRIPLSLRCSFLRRHQAIFTLSCEVSPPIPKRKWDEAMCLCHEYHVTQPFGRFFLQPGNAEQTQATLCFDAHLDASDGITVALLETFVVSHLSGACGFLLEPHVLKLLSPARPKKRRQAHTTMEVTHT
jgi:hypothetical protein